VFPIVLGDDDPTLPVELSTFTVSLNSFNNAVLNWVTQTETGVSGFYVYRNNSENLASATLVSHLIPATNSSEEHSYSFTDKELFSHGTYYYWLQVADIDGSESYHGPATLVYTGDNEPALPSIPTVTELRSIFPNPFNPNTNLSYSLAEEAEVSVKIYNARGQLVRTLNEGRKAVGHHSAAWDGKDDRGQNQSTGVYFFRMQAGKKVFNSKAVLMK
jgi:flagellar hook assembly protein FlgD